ncbi:aldehyde dehydrogenase (NADP(+)) [Glycomyces buryatensis]|uniref:Aldehyde dehydrogenase (NADP(+)) n=1 Tax=Glycomyces buryatensis TaxID=2570927 RepID=A0A4S8QC08_9ACTN|nr:aldehyde dehydrogenase (NADP(+)) [Glycomyces buryatensis]THV41820.1 aldehyde dehydrogenase (NADP(+)) [Glycomyces buryatensis]
MSAETSIDPRTGAPYGVAFAPTTSAEVARIAAAAAEAAGPFEAAGRGFRAGLLRAIGDALEDAREQIVTVADRETGLGEKRLGGELTRTVYQARLFADVLDEGSYLEAAIDHAGPTPMGPGPDLRRMLVPIGPVAVFGAGNFPLAFAVPGGDTVSALAAGSPVVIKAHPSHPATSRLTFDLMARAAAAFGAPQGILSLVSGLQAGADLVADPRIRAVAFTGSLRGGKALLEIINARPEPIPFYGELSSLNPVVVTEAAAATRGDAIAAGLVGSFTASGGQLCTKPGLVFVPAGEAGDALVAAAVAATGDVAAPWALGENIGAAYDGIASGLASRPGVKVIAEGGPVPGEGFAMRARLLTARAADLSEADTEECFGPLAIIARYDGEADLRSALDRLPASLTGTLHCEDDEDDLAVELTEALRAKAGRVLYNGFPTGVLVSWAQTHGGPWPSTNTAHTSVGTTAIRRFLRPVTWQDAPEAVLPAELQDGDAGIPRRIDGRLMLP